MNVFFAGKSLSRSKQIDISYGEDKMTKGLEVGESEQ